MFCYVLVKTPGSAVGTQRTRDKHYSGGEMEDELREKTKHRVVKSPYRR